MSDLTQPEIVPVLTGRTEALEALAAKMIDIVNDELEAQR